MDFTNKKEVINTTYEAQNEQYRYLAEVVTTRSGTITAVSMSIFEKLQDGRESYAGHLALRDSNKSMSTPGNQPAIAHMQVFEDFLSSLQTEEPVEDPVIKYDI